MSTIVEAPPHTAADLLERAALLLEEFGWRQGSPGSRADGSMCAVGAILEAAHVVSRWDDATQEAVLAFGRPANFFETFPLAAWNDEPGRTKAEVVAKLRDLAEEVRAKP